MGKTIIVSSHILPELADICNKIGIIDRGVMEVNAAVADVMKQVRQRTLLNVEVMGDIKNAVGLLEKHDSVEEVAVKDGRMVVTLKENIIDYSDLPSALIGAGLRIKYFGEEPVNLEAAFMDLTKGMGQKI